MTVTADGQPTRGRRGGPDDNLVLAVRRRRPRRKVALIDEAEELIAGDAGARLEQVGKDP